MKTIKTITTLLLLIAVGLSSSCKKDQVMYGKGFETFKFIVKDALNVETEYPGVISGDEIIVALPTEIDVTHLKASFTIDNPRTIVQVDTKVQESGISEQDFSQPVSYKVKAEDKSTRSYSVRIEKKIALQSFGFFKADNPVLEEDYHAVIKGLTIDISVHETIDLTKLVARFQTTTGSTLKVGSISQESKVTPNNFGKPVVYTFTDAGLPDPLNFNVQLSFIGPKWWMIGDKSMITSTTNGLKMAIHPFTKYPYIVYNRAGKDEKGVDLPDTEKKVAVISYTGTDWKYLGLASGISETRADLTNIAFDDEGTPYVGYKDYFGTEQKATVLKFVNDTWTSVGDKNFSPMRVDKFSFTVGENNQPMIGASTFTAIPGFAKRAIYVSNFTAGQWANITPAVASPLIGGVQVFKGLDGKTYMAVLDRNSSLSMYKFQNNTWNAIGPVGFRTSDNLPAYTSVIGAASAAGEVYIGYQTVISSERINRILKFNKATSLWEELGSAGNSQGTEKYALAIDPKGKLYFAFANNFGLYVKTFNDETKNWNNQRLVVSGTIDEFDMQVSADEIPYIVVRTAADKKTAVYKYTITK
ncbi:putative glycoside hydrolase [compost metagenome]